MCVTIPTYSLYMNRNTRIPCLVRDSATDSPVDAITSPGDAVAVLDALFHASLLAEEHVYVLAMDTQGRPLAAFDASHGDVAMAPARPREILLRVLLAGAASFIIAHNHPSGVCIPSDEDRKATQAIADAGRLIGMTLADHIVIGSEGYYSMRNDSTITIAPSLPPLPPDLDEDAIPFA